MKFYRYMSIKEMNKMLAGCPIIGKSRFSAKTGSSGICFLGEFTEIDDKKFDAVFCHHFLYGIVNDEVLVEFECKNTLTESWGVYADPFGSFDEIIITEFCIPEYDREFMIPLRYRVDYESNGEWYLFN